MGVKLIVLNGKKVGMEVPVAGPRFFIGSAKGCHIRLHGNLVDKYHCMIVVRDKFMAVRDLGSKCGTHVNGKVIGSVQELKAGDRIKVGALEFEVQPDVNMDVKKKTMVHVLHKGATRTVEPIEDDDLDHGSLMNETLNDAQILNIIRPERCRSKTTTATIVEGLRRQSSREKLEKDKRKPVEAVGVCKNHHWEPSGATASDAAAQVLKKMLRHR